MDKLYRLEDGNAVPLTLMNNTRFARADIHGRVGFRLTRNSYLARNDNKDFISIRVNLASVRRRRVRCTGHEPHSHPIDPLRRTGLTLSLGNRQITTDIQ
jgi:hypothetical protein